MKESREDRLLRLAMAQPASFGLHLSGLVQFAFEGARPLLLLAFVLFAPGDVRQFRIHVAL
jgi:hypothetical protein